MTEPLTDQHLSTLREWSTNPTCKRSRAIAAILDRIKELLAENIALKLRLAKPSQPAGLGELAELEHLRSFAGRVGKALEVALKSVDEAYEDTGHFRVSTSSVARISIGAAIVEARRLAERVAR